MPEFDVSEEMRGILELAMQGRTTEARAAAEVAMHKLTEKLNENRKQASIIEHELSIIEGIASARVETSRKK